MEPLEPRLLLSVLASTLPAGYVDANIGSPQVSGAADYVQSGNQWSVTGAGAGISGKSDQFNYAYANWTGGTLITKIGTVGNTGAGAQAGLMIRDSSAAGAEFAAVLVNPSNQVSFEYRNSTGGNITSKSTGKISGSIWLELVQGQSHGAKSFTAYYSTDDKHWTAINTSAVNINFINSTNLAGLIVASGNAKQTDSVNFSGFSPSQQSSSTQNSGPLSPGSTVTVTTAAAANPGTITGATTALSVGATDSNSSNTLTYTWSVTAKPNGAANPTFNVNGASTAKNTTATFSQAGAYTLLATITDSSGASATSSVTVTVNQTLTSIGVSPSSPTVNTLGSQQFSVMELDQFGKTMTTQPVITWSVTGGGSINSSGLYTAPASTGTATVKATSGSVSGSDNISVIQTAQNQPIQSPNSSSSIELPGFSYSMPSSNPALQSGMDTFTPPSGGTTTSGAPIIDASDSIGGPNNSITLTGAQFTSYTGSGAYSDTQFLVYGQTSSGNATLTNAQIQDTSVDGVTITIPSTEPANSMYLVWAQNNSGVSTPIAVNQTQAWWLSNAGNTSPGQAVSVYGENLSNGAATPQSWVYLQPTAGGQGQWATITSVNPYQVDFTVPTALTNGTYQVWVNNGLGGNYSWSEASTLLTVQGSSSWNPALMVNVQNYGATGNGKTNDGPAILDAIGALQSGDTLYFPTGTYLVDGEQLILPSNVRVLGAGQNQSTIEFQGAVPNNGLGAFEIGVYSFNDQHNVEFDSLTLEYAGPETYSMNSGTSLVSEANGTNFTFNNVTILANDLQPINWEGSNELTLENSTILGLDISVIGAHDMSITNNSFYEGYDTGEAIIIWNAYNINITNNQVDNAYQYTGADNNQISANNSSGWGQGRFLENNLDYGPIYNEYVANNTTDLGTLLSITPDGQGENSGEQILYEGDQDSAYGFASSITANTVTFASSTFDPDTLSGFNPTTDFHVGMNVIVTDGLGVGQMRTVTNVSFSTNAQGVVTSVTLALNNPWTVTPNSISKIDVCSTAYNDVVYKNNLQDQTGANGAATDWAATGIEVFEGAYGLIIDGNTTDNLNGGINFWSFGVENPVYFIQAINNNIENSQEYGIGYVPTPSQNLGNSSIFTDSDPNFIGVTLRNNTITSTPEGIALLMPQSTSTAMNDRLQAITGNVMLSVVEDNMISSLDSFTGQYQATGSFYNQFNKTAGIAVFTDPNVLIYQNTVSAGTSGSPPPAVWFADASPSALLQNNTYQGYSASQIYAGTLLNGTLQLPQEVYSQTLAPGVTVQTPISLQNDGATSLSWTGSSSAPWLTFLSPSGSIANENSNIASLVFNTNGLAAGTYSATVTITNGLQTRNLTVLLTVN